MLGAIAGDVIGSIYEFANTNATDFSLFDPPRFFTDDTVLTVAVADALMSGQGYVAKFKDYFDRYPRSGFGGMFFEWARSDRTEPYNSFGNGSAMRVSPVGFAFDSLEEVLVEAEKSAAVTHNHPEGIKGAQATAACIYLARVGRTKEQIQEYVVSTFGYNLDDSLELIRERSVFDETCQGSVPQAITAFLHSNDFEDAIRKAVSLGGDSDTIACITGGIAEAFYGGVPPEIACAVLERLDASLRVVVEAFRKKYRCP